MFGKSLAELVGSLYSNSGKAMLADIRLAQNIDQLWDLGLKHTAILNIPRLAINLKLNYH